MVSSASTADLRFSGDSSAFSSTLGFSSSFSLSLSRSLSLLSLSLSPSLSSSEPDELLSESLSSSLDESESGVFDSEAYKRFKLNQSHKLQKGRISCGKTYLRFYFRTRFRGPVNLDLVGRLRDFFF